MQEKYKNMREGNKSTNSIISDLYHFLQIKQICMYIHI